MVYWERIVFYYYWVLGLASSESTLLQAIVCYYNYFSRFLLKRQLRHRTCLRRLGLDTNRNVINQFTHDIRPVSYTHLDVYKRQG